MKIIISNKIKLEDAPPDLKEFLVQQFKIPNPKFLEAQKLGYSTYGIDQYIINFNIDLHGNLFIPRGYRRTLLELLKEMNILYTLEDERTKFSYVDINSSEIHYRDYQTNPIIQLVSQGEGVLVAPAGSGKTVLGLSLVPLLGQPTLWITHTGPLFNQTVSMVNKLLPSLNIGTVEDGKWNLEEIFNIGMVQTLIKDPKRLVSIRNKFGLVIVDEVHRCAAPTFTDVVSQLNPYYLYGLTATPYRRDKLESIMFQTMGPLNTKISIEKVIDSGGIILPTVRYKTIHSKRVDTNNIQTILKDYVVNNNKRNHTIVSDVLEEAVNNNFCIVVSDRREHCEILYNLISLSWGPVGIATGKYSRKYVQEQIDKFNNKEITVLVTTSQLLGEGFDVPFINRAFITMPFRAEAKAEQIIGRVQRTYPGKKDSIVYDYVDADIGILANQFYSHTGSCRHNAYTRLGIAVEPY